MTVNELMIGDFVRFKDSTDTTRIDSIDELDEEVGWDGEIGLASMFEPIPLTPEILEKNGFVNKEEKGWMQKGNFGDSPLILWYVKDTGKFNPHFANELEISDLSKVGGFRLKIQCKYVHELQHALRLCGLTELVDNFKIE